MFGNPASEIIALQNRIDTMLLRGSGLNPIEEMINSVTALNEEQKSALWLYAWAHLPRGVARREAKEMLAMFGE